MMKVIRLTLIAATIAFSGAMALADELQDGWTAYNAGDYATALKKWRPLAEQGLAEAQLNLGVMYNNGLGVLQDYAEAVKWWRLAAEQGDADAQLNLGVVYAMGLGVPQDDAEAVKWWRLAAKQGDANAQFSLGAVYSLGQGVPQDYVTAHMWVNIAATNGSEEARQVRDLLAERMSPANISDAQARARVCTASNYTDCD